jgi:glycosyltransferase involved in cell wall biosynthesis
MYSNIAKTGDWTVSGPDTKIKKGLGFIRGHLGSMVASLQSTTNPILHSPAILPSRWAKRINNSDIDIAHLHWVNADMMSIHDIGLINKPLVWTLHDMWAFCGAEHLSNDNRWYDGYSRNNRPKHESGLDINKWTWERKKNNWRRPIQIVTPSTWLAEHARSSALMQHWPVSVIPNTINTDQWQPIGKKEAREILGLPTHIPLIMFGAVGGGQNHHKGFDLLMKALEHLRGEERELQLVVIGQRKPKVEADIGFQINYMGHIHDDVSLRLIYSAADATIIPSRVDNLPNAGPESLACGTPVVAFNTCGLPDIVEHKANGYLAEAFNPESLAKGIQWVIGKGVMNSKSELSINARATAVLKYSYPVVAQQYLELYNEVLR